MHVAAGRLSSRELRLPMGASRREAILLLNSVVSCVEWSWTYFATAAHVAQYAIITDGEIMSMLLYCYHNTFYVYWNTDISKSVVGICKVKEAWSINVKV